MAEKDTSTENTEVTNKLTDQPDVDIAPDEPTSDPLDEPLFDDEDVSDEELRGEDDNEDIADEGTEEEEEVETSEKKDSDEEESSSDEEKDDGGEEDSSERPPKGYVTIAALHEERKARQALQSRVNSLIEKFEKDDTKEKDEEETGPTLEEELAEAEKLAPTDPDEAVVKLVKIVKKSLETSKDEKVKASQETISQKRSEVINKSYELMEEAVPGIFDEKAGVNEKLMKFAADNGLSGPLAAILTDPSAAIMVKGMKKPVILGSGAANVLKFIAKTYEFSGRSSESVEEMEARLTKEITTKVMKKVKAGSHEFTNLSDLPGDDDLDDNVWGEDEILSESAMSKLTPEQEREYLGR